MGDLGGKTLFRLLERKTQPPQRSLPCFANKVRISSFARGPKKIANLLLGRDLHDDVNSSGANARKRWNSRMNRAVDMVLKMVRNGGSDFRNSPKALTKYYGTNFRNSPLTSDEWVFHLCECANILHYAENARKKSLRRPNETVPGGRRVLQDYCDQSGSDDDGDGQEGSEMERESESA